jgi:hypothetical protein
VLFSVFAPLAQGAEVIVDSPSIEVKIGSQFEAKFFFKAEEYINAIEGEIIFPPELLEITEIREANSIINLWVEQPKLKQEGLIYFSGIIPGGYRGEKGLLFSAVFQTKKTGTGLIKLENIRSLLNDGKGTETKTTVSELKFSVAQEAPVFVVQELKLKDREPPESFKPMIGKDPEIFEGKYFLVFTTEDKGSGIDHYEVSEKRKYRIGNWEFGIGKPKWVKTESPYILNDQELRSDIYVKAKDRAGNERIETIEARQPLKWYEFPFVWSIIIISAGVFILGAIFFIRRKVWQRIKQ